MLAGETQEIEMLKESMGSNILASIKFAENVLKEDVDGEEKQ